MGRASRIARKHGVLGEVLCNHARELGQKPDVLCVKLSEFKVNVPDFEKTYDPKKLMRNPELLQSFLALFKTKSRIDSLVDQHGCLVKVLVEYAEYLGKDLKKLCAGLEEIKTQIPNFEKLFDPARLMTEPKLLEDFLDHFKDKKRDDTPVISGSRPNKNQSFRQIIAGLG